MKQHRNALDAAFKGDDWVPQSLPKPDTSRPGTQQRLDTFARRLDRGEELWSPHDTAQPNTREQTEIMVMTDGHADRYWFFDDPIQLTRYVDPDRHVDIKTVVSVNGLAVIDGELRLHDKHQEVWRHLRREFGPIHPSDADVLLRRIIGLI